MALFIQVVDLQQVVFPCFKFKVYRWPCFFRYNKGEQLSLFLFASREQHGFFKKGSTFKGKLDFLLFYELTTTEKC